MFSTLGIKRSYRTKKDKIDDDFIIPLLKNSRVYDRGTGFFSISSLSNIAKGLIPYIKNGGKVRIITSVELDEDNIKVIKQGYEQAKQEISNIILDSIIQAIPNDVEQLELDLITNLIAANVLQIKIAYLPNGGIYHEKIGYFEDNDNEKIWFSGSINETYNGYEKNAESFLVLKSWCGDEIEINELKNYFDDLWNDFDPSIRTFDFPEAAKLRLFNNYKKSDTVGQAISLIENEQDGKITPIKKLYEYQEKAINEFIGNDFCHFFEMATGTGKTFTSVKAIQKMEELVGEPVYVMIVVPQIDLQEQWKRELEANNIKVYLFGGIGAGGKYVDNEYNDSIIDYYSNNKFVVAISTYDTYFARICSDLDKLPITKMIIIDEAHELSNNQMNKLSNSYKYRLGLSATPERHNSEETDRIVKYFTKGKIETFKYTIDEAIQKGFLSKYEYYPIYVHLNDEEFNRYQQLTKQMAVELNKEKPDWDRITDISNNRSIIVKKATNKPEKLLEMIESKKYNFVNSVVYCGQGKDVNDEELIIDKVTKYLSLIGKLNVKQYTSKTIDRPKVLREFENGYYDTLIAIKCFDQGVDVPKLDKIYILASDALNRQTIQRRGRVLRQCKESGKEMAYIYDMITLPPLGVEDGLGVQPLVAKEIKRAKEYNRLAENKDEIELLIGELINRYGITEESDDEKEENN